MNSSKALSEAVLSIRETANIVASRGVCLKNYKNELLPYRILSKLAGLIMKKMFADNLLTRKIMTLHSNLTDLLFVCKSVYECGRENHVQAPIFYTNYNAVQKQMEQ
jgi:2-dehydropantoate 2-reductase